MIYIKIYILKINQQINNFKINLVFINNKIKNGNLRIFLSPLVIMTSLI